MGKHDLSERVNRFWQRVTEGMQLSQLWSQFRTDAHSSYRLYSREVDSTRVAGVAHRQALLQRGQPVLLGDSGEADAGPSRVVAGCLGAGLRSGRRVDVGVQDRKVKVFALDFHFYGGLLMFALLILEVGDRVVMKRDLQIAKEIQTWLLPASPPQVPGLEIAFATRPANTVAGDYYDVFARPGPKSRKRHFSDCHCRRRRQEHPRCHADGNISGELENSQQHTRLADGTGRPDESLCLQQQPERPPLYHRLYRRIRPRFAPIDLCQRGTQRSHPAPPIGRHRAAGDLAEFRSASWKMLSTNQAK